MDCPACAAPVPPASTWCPNCGGALPAAVAPPPRPRASADPAAGAAGKALWCSLPALCCIPLSLPGAFYAARAVSLARQYGIPVPRRAVAAWVLVAVSLLTWSVLVGSYISFQLQNRRALQAIQERLAGKRETAAIDQQTACDLVEEQLRAGLYDGWSPERVTCQGPLETGPGWALLRRVDVHTKIDHARLNACLARGQRWFALKMTSAERCPPPPPAARPGLAAEVEERTLRQEAAEQADQEDVAAFNSALARVKDALAERPRATRSCPLVDVEALRGPGAEQLRLFTVDLEALDARTAEGLNTGWDFLTSSDVRLAMDPRASTKFRANSVRDISRESGPYLVVYQTDERAWPSLDDDDEQPAVTSRGSFTGWLVVVDLSAARPVCEAALQFGTSAEYWERPRKKRKLDAAVKDLKDQFERRAISALRGISEGRLRLGYRLVE